MSDAAENLEIEEPEKPVEEAPPAEPEQPAAEAPQEDKPEPAEDDSARIRRLAYEGREAKRQAREAEERAREAEEKLRASQQPQRPVVPEKPSDPYDPNYEKDMAAWADAVAEQKAYDQQALWQEQQAVQQQIAAQEAQAQAYQQKANDYFARADKLGISQTEINQASEAINAFQIDQSVVDHLLADQRGPEMAVYLKDNPAELLKVSEMSPMQAGIYLENEVKAKSRREPPQVAPPPVETDTGSSVTETDDGFTLE